MVRHRGWCPGHGSDGRRRSGCAHARARQSSFTADRDEFARVEQRHSTTSEVCWMPARGKQRTPRVIQSSVGSMAARNLGATPTLALPVPEDRAIVGTLLSLR